MIDCSNQLPDNSPTYSTVSLIGSSGAAYSDDHHNCNLLFHPDSSIAANVSSADERLQLQITEFANAIEKGSLENCFDELAARKSLDISLSVQSRFSAYGTEEATDRISSMS